MANTKGLMEQKETETTGKINSGRACSVFSVAFVSSHCERATMHPLFAQAFGSTHGVIGTAIEVHKDKGPGLLESIYKWC
jgi:hypothetical protein